jgi:chromate transporter
MPPTANHASAQRASDFFNDLLGGLLTTWVTFVPCFLWIFLGAAYVGTLRSN